MPGTTLSSHLRPSPARSVTLSRPSALNWDESPSLSWTRSLAALVLSSTDLSDLPIFSSSA